MNAWFNGLRLSSRSLIASRCCARPLQPSTSQVTRRWYNDPRKYRRFGNPGGTSSRNGGQRRAPEDEGSGHESSLRKYLPARDTPLKISAGIGLLIGLFIASNMERVPETGRLRFIYRSARLEAYLEEMSKHEVLQEYEGKILPHNHYLSQHVRKVAARILAASNLGVVKGEDSALVSPSTNETLGDDLWNPDASHDFGRSASPAQKEWIVVVVNDPKLVNAFAAPGIVVVSTGMLPICKDQEGLAAVLGHEIGHVMLQHVQERTSAAIISFSLLAVLLAFGVDISFGNFIRNLIFDLPNSRRMETEADMVGLRLMSRACFDPQSSPDMFRRLAEVEGRAGRGLGFFRTHPTSDKRVKDLEEKLPEAYDILAASPECAGLRDQVNAFREIRLRPSPDTVADVW